MKKFDTGYIAKALVLWLALLLMLAALLAFTLDLNMKYSQLIQLASCFLFLMAIVSLPGKFLESNSNP
jgi:hypothetical protein